MDSQALKKGEASMDSLKRKIEQAEQEYESKVKQLNDEKEELKKKN